MEIGHILNELWRRRGWVALGLLFALLVAASTVYRLPSFEKKSFELGAASTEVLVDAPRSPLGALGTDPNKPNADVQTLVTRAQVYARLISSPPVKDRVARELGVPSPMIATQGPQPGVASPGQESSAEERGAELLTEGNEYRLFASSSEEIPIVGLAAQAPTGEGAVRLADAAARAIAQYVREIQERQEIPPSERVQIQQLGNAIGGVVNQGVDRAAAALAFFGSFGVWCLFVLLGSRAVLSWHEARRGGRGHHEDTLNGRKAPQATEDIVRRDEVSA